MQTIGQLLKEIESKKKLLPMNYEVQNEIDSILVEFAERLKNALKKLEVEKEK